MLQRPVEFALAVNLRHSPANIPLAHNSPSPHPNPQEDSHRSDVTRRVHSLEWRLT